MSVAPISAAVAKIMAETTATELPELLIENSPTLSLDNLPERLDDRTLALMEKVASSPLPPLAACDEVHFLKCLRILQANLPKRAVDDLSGELILATYQRMLGEQPKDAISYLTEQALSQCRWFPTINECKEILSNWQRKDSAVQRQRIAQAKVRSERRNRQWERQAQFDATMGKLMKGQMSQDQIDELPESWKDVGVTRAYLWQDKSGCYTSRIERAQP